MWNYAGYGLTILANEEVPGLLPALNTRQADLSIYFGQEPHSGLGTERGARTTRYVSAFRDSSGRPGLVIDHLADGNFLHIRYSDGARYIVNRALTALWIPAPHRPTRQTTMSYLLGPIMGIILRLRGVTCLHASVISVWDRAVLFVGDAMAGKSTTAMAFALQGYEMLSDDLAPLFLVDDRLWVQPGYPRARLRATSLAVLNGLRKSGACLPETPTDRRLHLDLREQGLPYCDKALPLAAVYLLGDRTDEETAPSITPIVAREALISLIGNAYGTRILNAELRESEFELLGGLVDQVPVCRLHAHANPQRLSDLCQLVVDDVCLNEIN